MTKLALPDVTSSVSDSRRGGGAGGPAAHPVPPREREASGMGLGSAGDSPFRLGAAGLVVMIVPAELRAACARRGWSLTFLARRAGISYPTLKSSLRGRAIRPRTAWRLANALSQGTEVAELNSLVGPA